MKICMMSLMMGRNTAPSEIVKTASDCGMAAIDWVTTHDTPARELRKLSSDAGLKIAAYTPLQKKFIRGEAGFLDEFKQVLEDAVELEAPVMMVPPFPLENQSSPAEGRKRWIEYYAQTLPLAQKAGVVLTIESTGFAISPVTTGEEIREVLDAVPGLKVTFDNGNTATACDMTEAYEMLRPHVVHFHLKDWKIYDAPHEHADRKRCGKYFADAVIGTGDLDLKRFWQEHVADSYDGFVNLETLDPTGKLSQAEVMRQVTELLKNW